MIINLAAYTTFDVDDTVSGTVSLTRAQLQALVDEDYTTDVATLSGSDILVLDVDYGNRIATYDLRYYFDSATASGTVASGIQWLYKNYDSDPWYALTTVAGGGYYTTTTISGTFFPRQIRLVHTISGTGVVGSLREFETLSDDTIVDFGSDGSLETKHLTETPIGESDPFTVPIYNDGSVSATAYVYIGNTDTDADDMLKISDSENGTYVSINDGFLIDGDQDGIGWGNGNHNDTTVSNSKLVLTSFGGSLSFTKLEDIPIAVDTLERGCVRWHATNPNKSEVYYAQDSAFRMYSLEDDTDIIRAVMPFTMTPRDRFIYDPEGDKIYAFDFNSTTTTFYRYDPTTDTWSASLGSFSNSPVTDYPVGALAFIPSNVLNDGARSIIAMCGTGRTGVNPTTPIRIRLTDHNVNTSWGNLTGFYTDYDGTNRTSEYQPVMNLTFQGSNLDAFPAGCQGVLWATQHNYFDVWYLNYFVIYEGDSNHRWYYSPLSALPTCGGSYHRTDTWYQYNNDTWVYDEANNYVWYVEDPGWQAASQRLHYFECDGTFNRCYETMYDPYTDLDPDGYFWYEGGTSFRKRNYMDGKVYGDTIYFVCMSGHDKNLIYLFTPGYGTGSYYEEGTYTTPIFKNTDPTYWRVKSEIPANTEVAASENAVSPTIEIRSSDTAPTGEDSHYVLEQVRNGDYYLPTALYYDGSERWQNTQDQSYCYYSYQLGSTMAINEWYPEVYNSSHTFAFFAWNNRRIGGYFNRLRFNLYNYWGGRISARNRFSHTDDNNYYRATNAVFAKNGMIYVTYRGIGTEYDRLDCLDNNTYWASTLEFTGDQSTLYSMCVGGDDWEDLWLIKEDENEIRRYNQNLQLQQTIENQSFGNLNGICQDGEGGFFVGETQSASRKFHHYDYTGTLVASYDVSDHINSIHRMMKDYYGGLWILDTNGEQIARFASNGTFIGKQTLLSPQGLSSTPLGCWVVSEVYDRHYFINLNVGVQKVNVASGDTVISYDGDNWSGATSVGIDANGYMDPDFTTSDSVWGTGGSLEWSEVGKDTNFVPRKTYHQARITLRSDGTDTPEVEKVALPPAVTLYNIGTQASKDVYMKTDVEVGTDDALRQGKIRTWFSVEE